MIQIECSYSRQRLDNISCIHLSKNCIQGNITIPLKSPRNLRILLFIICRISTKPNFIFRKYSKNNLMQLEHECIRKYFLIAPAQTIA